MKKNTPFTIGLILTLFASITSVSFILTVKYHHSFQQLICRVLAKASIQPAINDVVPYITGGKETDAQIPIELTISALGDCTLGTDERFTYKNSFTDVFYQQNEDYSYFFKNVQPLLSDDDLTIANLETTLTTAEGKIDKSHQEAAFWFKGRPDYTRILRAGSIEAVNLANNHTFDYLEQGHTDTINHLQQEKIACFGNEDTLIKELKGIKVGLIGLNQIGANEIPPPLEEFKKDVVRKISKLKKEADLVIVSFHWGIEYEIIPSEEQIEVAKLAIDSGADLVIGHHPHIFQGVQEYKGKTIVYSLGNFVFGGNRNPREKETLIYQHKFSFIDKKLVASSPSIIACTLYNEENIHQYCPTILKGEQKTVALNKFRNRAIMLKYLINGMSPEDVRQIGLYREKVDENILDFKQPLLLKKEAYAAGKDTDLVNLREFAPEIKISLQYGLPTNFTKKQLYYQDFAYLRLATAKKFLQANKILQEQGYTLLVWDAYRPPEIQWLMWELFPDPRFLANPQVNYSKHCRGTAIDVTLLDSQGKEVKMPSEFDDFTDKAIWPYHSATSEEKKAAEILRQAMSQAGFTPLSSEWWHFTDNSAANCGIIDLERLLSFF